MALEIAVKEVDGISIVSLNGTLTAGTTLSIAEAKIHKLIDAAQKRIALDLSNVSYADSGGLGMLVNAYGTMTSVGGKMRFCGANQRLHKLFTMTHTDAIFPLDADLETSLTHLREVGVGA